MPTVAKITAEKNQENAYVVHISGEIDVSNLPELEGVVNPLLQKDATNVYILDCSGLEFMDSKVVGYIAYLYTTLKKSQKNIFIIGANDTINDILTLVGLTSIIPAFSTSEEALNSLKQS